MTPSPTLLGRSAYTVLGALGYIAAVTTTTILAIAWQLTLGERLVAVLAPPIAFLAVTTVATALKGREWIVFYQTAAGAIATTMIAGLLIGANLPRLADVTVTGIGTFLVFGRIGCFRVACCHGRPVRRGVMYDERHVALGLWSACAYRPLLPVQLIEAVGSALLIGGALLAAAEPGRAACVFAVGYAMMRFVLELLRGDPVRPVFLGVSEAQWWCVVTATACAIARPAWWAIAGATVLAIATLAVAATHRRRELLELRHVRDLDDVCAAVLADPLHAPRDTALGVAATCHELPDGRLDWVWSSSHPAWSLGVATRLAGALCPGAEIFPGRTPGVMHVIVASSDDRQAYRSGLPRHDRAHSRGSSSSE
jgi:hypothetical protein